MRRMGVKGSKFKAGKGAKEEYLPSRHAMQSVAPGKPEHRTMNNYAKAVPKIDAVTKSIYDLEDGG